MSRSNMFANIENNFRFAEKEELKGMTMAALDELLNVLGETGMDSQNMFLMSLSAATVGIMSDGVLCEEEKELVKDMFGQFWSGDIESLYGFIESQNYDGAFKLVEGIVNAGPQLAMPFLYVILGFAYSDGVFEEELAEQLDKMYGLILLADFFQSGEEEVPAPKVLLKGLSAEIMIWFEEEDPFVTIEEVCEKFPSYSQEEVQAALDELCELGVAYQCDIIGGLRYAKI